MEGEALLLKIATSQMKLPRTRPWSWLNFIVTKPVSQTTWLVR